MIVPAPWLTKQARMPFEAMPSKPFLSYFTVFFCSCSKEAYLVSFVIPFVNLFNNSVKTFSCCHALWLFIGDILAYCPIDIDKEIFTFGNTDEIVIPRSSVASTKSAILNGYMIRSLNKSNSLVMMMDGGGATTLHQNLSSALSRGYAGYVN